MAPVPCRHRRTVCERACSPFGKLKSPIVGHWLLMSGCSCGGNSLLVFTESALINGHGGSQKKHTAVQARMEKDTTQQLHWGLGVVEAQAAKAENTSERRKGQEPHGAWRGLGRGCCSLAAGGVEMPHTGGEVVGVTAAMEGKQQDIIAKKI